MNIKKTIGILILLITGVAGGMAQKVALKTNMLSDVALTPNLGVEIGLSPKWTLDISGQLNAWNVDGKRWRHWLAYPEARYWFCNTFQGNFLGFHAFGGQFNVGNIHNNLKIFNWDFSRLSNYRYQGWAAGAGVAWGHAWILATHWNIELEVGVGWAYMKFDTYPCAGCGSAIQKGRHRNYVGPTKLALNLEYVF